MRIALAALFTVLILSQVQSQVRPVNRLNNVELKAAQAAHTGQRQPATLTVKTAAKVETPVAQTPEVQPEVVDVPSPPTYPSSHEELMAAAGISPADYGAVDYIVSHESSWNPEATEPTTGAHGLPQALPYSKTGCGWDDAVCQLVWANTYATSRYGGWWNAYDYWVAHRNW